MRIHKDKHYVREIPVRYLLYFFLKKKIGKLKKKKIMFRRRDQRLPKYPENCFEQTKLLPRGGGDCNLFLLDSHIKIFVCTSHHEHFSQYIPYS